MARAVVAAAWRTSSVARDASNIVRIGQDAEVALDASRRAHADLDVALLVEAGGGVDGLALEEDAANGVELREACLLARLVEVLENCTVEKAAKAIAAALVSRRRLVCGLVRPVEILVRSLTSRIIS